MKKRKYLKLKFITTQNKFFLNEKLNLNINKYFSGKKSHFENKSLIFPKAKDKFETPPQKAVIIRTNNENNNFYNRLLKNQIIKQV